MKCLGQMIKVSPLPLKLFPVPEHLIWDGLCCGFPKPGSSGPDWMGLWATLVGDVPWGLELVAFKVSPDPTHPLILAAEGREKLVCFHSRAGWNIHGQGWM